MMMSQDSPEGAFAKFSRNGNGAGPNVPKEMRDDMGLSPGDEVFIECDSDERLLRVVPAEEVTLTRVPRGQGRDHADAPKPEADPEPEHDGGGGDTWDDGVDDDVAQLVRKVVEDLEPGERRGESHFRTAYLMITPVKWADFEPAFARHPEIERVGGEDSAEEYRRVDG